MGRKFLFCFVLLLSSLRPLCAQTNFQTLYDFGSDRRHVTTTLEGFYNDKWGNTFFFIDYDFGAKDDKGVNRSVSGSYLEIARCLNFWQESVFSPLSLHVEYDGGVGFPGQNFLFGADFFLHSSDFGRTFNFKLLYKTFNGTCSSDFPVQFTFVWGIRSLFGIEGLSLCGFADIWGENVINFAEGGDVADSFVFLSEPQLWYNVGRHIGVDNLSIGGEVELSCNFAGCHGFRLRPCLGTKWVF